MPKQVIRLALEQEPDNAEALTLLGQVLHETDRYDEAIPVLERASSSILRAPTLRISMALP